MTNSVKSEQQPDSYLNELKSEGAELLIRSTVDDVARRARLTLIDAKIEQLTSPITSGDWIDPQD
ncbi:hypothetical protein [Comamonas sp.]|uniref:hypothetical protein n=1 Tax=Comamonas sp. TaxID=34028 RepID=UPI00289845F6|nr:hypothetical protein [Comamonas sp.]